MGKVRNEYRILTGKSERKLPLRRFKRILENIIKTDLNEVGCEDADRIFLIQEKAFGELLYTR
jgi:hypothetical protein